jgi:hypothetical protein
MLSVSIDRNDSLLLHDQVATEIRRTIAEGKAVPGIDCYLRGNLSRSAVALDSSLRRHFDKLETVITNLVAEVGLAA